MSCNYADGLSPYDDKGKLGLPEQFDSEEKLVEKCTILSDWIRSAKHVVVHTGAGISTSAGIPDFRGPNGVWTLEKAGKKPNINISFDEAQPTLTHLALKRLVEEDFVKFIVSQNIDGLHLKSGLERAKLAELHGNMFVEQCNTCESQFVRSSACPSVGKKCLETTCKRDLLGAKGRVCRGKLHDTILDWEDGLPDSDLEISEYHSCLSDLNICLGTTLQIVPSGNLPLKGKKFGGKLVIVNLQPTKHDKKADLIINYYVDDVMMKVMKKLGVEIGDYSADLDPTKNVKETVYWNLMADDIKKLKVSWQGLKKRKLEKSSFSKKKLKKENSD